MTNIFQRAAINTALSKTDYFIPIIWLSLNYTQKKITRETRKSFKCFSLNVTLWKGWNLPQFSKWDISNQFRSLCIFFTFHWKIVEEKNPSASHLFTSPLSPKGRKSLLHLQKQNKVPLQSSKSCRFFTEEGHSSSANEECRNHGHDDCCFTQKGLGSSLSSISYSASS